MDGAERGRESEAMEDSERCMRHDAGSSGDFPGETLHSPEE